MNLENNIIRFASEKGQFTTREIANKYKVSRQYVHLIVKKLVQQKRLLKFGSTRKAFYVHPSQAKKINSQIKKRLINRNLEEHKIMSELENASQALISASDDIRSIYQYAFSEMLNNAIEHSKSKNIEVDIGEQQGDLVFHVNDSGIGAFRNIMKKRKLNSELEAIQDLLKGKTTTMPKSHSGEGIFFTSKIADIFILESFGYKMTIDNKIEDIFIEGLKSKKRGTKISFRIAMNSNRHLSDIFKKYQTDPGELAFDRTEVQIKLYTMGTIHISRSQARRVMTGLEKFNVIILDFDKVPTVGQAFVDEIFRVFKSRHSHIKIIPINMNKTVEFMMERGQPDKITF